jgi:cell division protease FtsH
MGNSMQKLSYHFYIFLLLLPTTTQPLLFDFLIELAAISEFNRHNRAELYKSIQKMFTPEQDFNQDFQFDPNLSPEEQVRAFSNRPFTFADLAGTIPEDIREIADVIRNPIPFARVGAKIPKGILLYGPPGTGKTSIARAIAGEATADFFQASGSEFIELYVGMGPKRVRELFDQARQCKKAIIFIDEIDAIGTKRSGETNSEYRNTLNELLRQMDGFTGSNITVIAATNRIEDLDAALLRPGRFDRLVEIPLPNQQSREEIFKLYCSRIAYYGSSAIYSELAQKSFGFSGADIKNVVNEAAVLAAREDSNMVTEEHLKQSLEKAVQQKRKTKK